MDDDPDLGIATREENAWPMWCYIAIFMGYGMILAATFFVLR